MSLTQHVTANEGVDREIGDTLFDAPERRLSVQSHVLSFDPFPLLSTEAPPTGREAAYKVPVFKRLVQVSIAVVVCWLASGIVFGFAALKPVLIAEGVYQELCTDDEGGETGTGCVEQDIRLNLFFTVASVATNVSALPIGAILDRYGRRVLYVAGSILLAAGSVLMGLAFAIPAFDGYIVANILLALGGSAIFIPSFQLAYAFPKHSGIIVALVTGSFDASAAVFLFYRLAYEASARVFAPAYFFFGYTLVPVLIVVLEFLVMPPKSYHTGPELRQKIEKAQDSMRDIHDSDDEIESRAELRQVRAERAKRRERRASQLEELVGVEAERIEKAEYEKERRIVSEVWGVLHGQPAHRQMLSPWFIGLLLLTMLQMLRMNYFIATLDSQYSFLVGEDRERQIAVFFDFALPIGGVAATPFIAVLLNHLSVPAVLGVIVVLITAIGVVNCLPFIWAGYITVVLFVIARPFYYSAVSDYATKVFGFATFGRIYGAIICFSGLINFSQSGLDALTLDLMSGNPTPVNAGMTIAGAIIGGALTVFAAVEGRHVREKQMEEDADAERQSLLPIDEHRVMYL
ncbi:amino acid transporter [Eremomyces bilateralis CBS 781.70]|uniref:Amino acid transporter n=1 Tax=Eremomyces bilateralis CBS 781.70 TaxID=1392243 RepID=A0A6G1GH57_9PEZI|nr:amino acid transporter [Eremomyces bilateralis CBS 781.70]KAF1817200.1 amino acid transporter [Eremomyces bilateralis CBS 781.70]